MDMASGHKKVDGHRRYLGRCQGSKRGWLQETEAYIARCKSRKAIISDDEYRRPSQEGDNVTIPIPSCSLRTPLVLPSDPSRCDVWLLGPFSL